MDQAVEGNFMTENQETVPGLSSEGVTEVPVSNEIAMNLVPDIQSNYMKNKTGNVKSKIQNVKTKEMTVASVPERKSLKRKAAHPPTSDMVMDSIKSLKKRNGASFEDIRKYMEEKYVVDMKQLKYYVDKFLQKSVCDGVIEKIDRGGAEGRFKIKKSEDIKKGSKNVPRKEGKGKPKKKMAAAINQNVKTKEQTVASVPERKSLKRKAAHPPTSDMVMDSIKSLKKRNGASFEDIRKYMEEKYVVDMKRLKYHVDKFLQKSVGDGVIEKIDRGGAEGRFKIKKSEDIKKGSKNVPRKEGKVKPEKKMAAAKQRVKK